MCTDGLLIRREDEGGSLGDDFGKAGGTLPGAREGTDRVDTTYVAESDEPVRNRGSN